MQSMIRLDRKHPCLHGREASERRVIKIHLSE
jgi:hypothetical protein